MVSAMVINATNVDKQLAMVMQTVKALKKFVEDKDRQIFKPISKLELYNRGESSHHSTPQAEVAAKSHAKFVIVQNAD